MAPATGRWLLPPVIAAFLARMRSSLVVLLLVSVLMPACTPEPKLSVVVSLRRSAASPVLATFAKETGANLDLRFVAAGDEIGDDFDVLWSADPAVTINQADQGRLAKLPAPALASRPPQLVDPDGLWVAVTADLRVIAYDPERVEEASIPTRFEQLVDPRIAPQVVIATPLSSSASWHFAALFASNGAEPTTAFLRDLRRAGATFVADERAVLDAVAGAGPPIGVLDGEVAFTGRELNRRIAVLIPDQDGSGAILRATTISIHKRSAPSTRALDLVTYLLSAPVGRRLALMSSHVALLGEDEPSAGTLTLRDLKIALPSQKEIAGQLSSVRRALRDLR